MLTTDDKKEIREIVREEVGEEINKKTSGIMASLAKIEKDRKVLYDIWDFVKGHANQLKDHEARIEHLESPISS